MSDTEVHRGSCMCKSVRFSFVGPPRFVGECVCEFCRHAHGASAVAWVGVKTPEFRIDSGEDCVSWYRSSKPSERGFCTVCGTRMFFRSDLWAGEVHMAVACIEPPHDLVATGIAFVGELPPWTGMQPAAHLKGSGG